MFSTTMRGYCAEATPVFGQSSVPASWSNHLQAIKLDAPGSRPRSREQRR